MALQRQALIFKLYVMQLLVDTFKKTGDIHHAYCIVGDPEDTFVKLQEFLLGKMKFEIKGNPDFWVGKFDTFTIDDSRILKEHQQNKAFGGGKKIFIVRTHTMTREAQNALLKVFEEPTPDTHFFILIRTKEGILATLLSRSVLIEETDTSTTHKAFAEEFLTATSNERLLLLKDMIEEKDREEALQFLTELERQLWKNVDLTTATPKETAMFDELLKMKGYLSDRSSSVKMILEHLSLMIPIQA